MKEKQSIEVRVAMNMIVVGAIAFLMPFAESYQVCSFIDRYLGDVMADLAAGKSLCGYFLEHAAAEKFRKENPNCATQWYEYRRATAADYEAAKPLKEVILEEISRGLVPEKEGGPLWMTISGWEDGLRIAEEKFPEGDDAYGYFCSLIGPDMLRYMEAADIYDLLRGFYEKNHKKTVVES